MLLTMLVLNFVGMVAPGPDIFLVLRLAVRSRARALGAAFGVTLGNIVWVTITVAGIAAVLVTHPAIMVFIQGLGGMWLVYLGLKTLRSGIREWKNRNNDLQLPGTDTCDSNRSVPQAIRMGLFTNLSNPKFLLILLSLFAPLVPPHPSLTVSLSIIAVMGLSTLAFFSFLAVVVSTKAIQQRLLKAGSYIDMGSGAIFAVVGATFLYEAASRIISAF